MTRLTDELRIPDDAAPTIAFGDCSSLKVPDHERNRTWLGKLKARFGLAG